MTPPLLFVLAASLSAVELRGAGAEPFSDPIVVVSPAGLTGVRLTHQWRRFGLATSPTISWDKVRRVTDDHAAEAAAFAEVSEDLWRARTRLSRGDISLAEPVFARLFDEFPLQGPTGLVIAEGLLRCRLARADQAAGVIEPWLTSVRLRRMGGIHPADAPPPGPPGGATDPPTASTRPIDQATDLEPSLPPMWLEGAEALAIADAVDAWAARSGAPEPVSAALAAWYVRAARSERAFPEVVAAALDAPGAHPSVRFVALVTTSRLGDDPARRRARAELEAGLADDMGTWREAWRRVAIGRSMLLEDDPAHRRRGVIHLLHVPARFRDAQPHLAAVALAEAGAELSRAGDPAAAARLLDELRRFARGHVAVRWLESRLERPGASPEAADRGAAR